VNRVVVRAVTSSGSGDKKLNPSVTLSGVIGFKMYNALYSLPFEKQWSFVDNSGFYDF
jgi:hypothetical protein